MIIVFTGEDLQKFFVYIVAVLPLQVYGCLGVPNYRQMD